MRKCSKCKEIFEPGRPTEYYCKPCKNAYMRAYKKRPDQLEKARQRANYRYSNDPEYREKIKSRARSAKHYLSAAASKYRKTEQFAIRRRAMARVHHAIQRGWLETQPCEKCGDVNAQAHHEDYSKPLEVVWLCSKHHAERHREMREEERNG